MSRSARWLAGLLLLALTGCALQPPLQPDTSPDFLAPDQDNWTVSGKFSFRGPKQRESGQFYWYQQGDSYRLRLTGPLGMGGAEVERHDQGVTIRAEGESYQGDNSGLLLYELTGIWIPLAELPDILLGRDERSHTEWEVEYEGVVEIENYRLPERLVLSSQEYQLQIFVSRWTL